MTIKTELVLTSIGYKSLAVSHTHAARMCAQRSDSLASSSVHVSFFSLFSALSFAVAATCFRIRQIPGLPFDSKRNIVPSLSGRVTSGGVVEAGLYVSGWLKRGPSGIIATNIMDARDTVKAILQDVNEGRITQPRAPTPLDILSPDNIAAKRIVSREAWASIDAIEQAKGLEEGKPRVKIASKEELLQAAGFKPTTSA